jgi:predicted nucleotidyltransferase
VKKEEEKIMGFGLPDSILENLQDVFKRFSNIEKVILYGSRAKGNFRQGSDIDITLYGNLNTRELLLIDLEIDSLLLPWIFDISLFSKLYNKNLIHHIERVGKVIYNRNL